jgi:hypothetical protein
MIETTYVRLEKAAEMLGTDRDTLVLAAMEERIKIYGFIGDALGATQYQRDETSFHKVFFEVDYVERFFTFVPIAPSMIIRLMTDGSCQAVTLSDEKDGYYLSVPAGLEDYSSYLIRREFIFMLKADVEKILSEGKTPAAESVAKPILVSDRRADTTLLNIIGGLLGIMLGNTPGGVRQSVYTSQNAIKEAFLAHYPGMVGERTLDAKFGAANKSVKQSKIT